MRTLAKIGIGVGILFALFLIFIAIVASFASFYVEENERKEQAVIVDNQVGGSTTITYNELIRNNEEHVGKTLQYEGEVYGIDHISADRYELEVAIGDYFFAPDKSVVVEYEGKRLVTGDLVRFNGDLLGLKEKLFRDDPLPLFKAIELEVIQPAT